MTLIYLALAWAFGLWLESTLDFNATLPIILILATLPGVLWWRKQYPILLLAVVACALGMLRFDAARPQTDAHHVLQLNDLGILTLEGRVVDEPQILDTSQRILVQARVAAGRDVHGLVLANVPRESEVAFGDEVQLFGRLSTPPRFDTFSYRDYLARQQIFSLMPGAQVEVRSSAGGIYGTLLEVKADAGDLITESLPEPHASLLVGILLGDETGISDETEVAFVRTGTSHIIAISGFNMTILAQFLVVTLGNIFPKRSWQVALPSLALIALYTIFVGAGAPVVRAAVMSGLLVIGQSLNRKTFVPTSLAFAAILMSALDPQVFWDVGFQLSFAAVLGMSLFVPPMEQWANRQFASMLEQPIGRVLVKTFIIDAFIVTLGAQITTLPLSVYYFDRLSIVSPLVNFLVIPVQPFILILGGFAVIVGLMLPTLGEVLLQIPWVFLEWSISVIEWFGGQSFSDVNFSLSEGVIAGFFAVLTLYTLYKATRPRWLLQRLSGWRIDQVPARYAYLGLGVVLVLLITDLRQRPDGDLHVTFLDVGHHHGVLIQTPDGGTLLIDGGRFPTRLLDEISDQLPARQRHIDVLILTSPNEDTSAALPEVARRYQIGAVVTNGQESNSREYAALLDVLAGVPITGVTAGYAIQTDDGVRLDVLHPTQPPARDTDPAEVALVLRLTYGDASFLITSDINVATERQLLVNPHLLQATVLQVADHGSGSATSLPFIDVVQPQVAVIQLEAGNIGGDPSPTVISRLNDARLFRTDEQGTIEIVTDGNRIGVYSER